MHACTNSYTYTKTLLIANKCIAHTYTKTLLIVNNKKIYLTGKLRFKLNKVGKTTRPFRYELSLIIQWK